MSKSQNRLNEELVLARKNLSDALGAKMKTYLKFIRSWLKKKISTEDFDIEARSLLSSDCVHLHNFFLIALLSKCQISNFTGCEGPIKNKKSKNRSGIPTVVMDSGTFRKFLPADPLSQAPQIRLQPYNPGASMPEYVVSDMFLPTSGLVHGRMLVSSWEHDLDGVDEDCIQLVLLASEVFLKNILTALACHKNPFALRRKKFVFAIGSRRMSSSTFVGDGYHRYVDYNESGLSTEFTEEGFIPSLKPTPSLAEQEAAVRLSKAAVGPSPSDHHLTLFDLLEVLQTRKSVIPCHTISTLLAERIINRMSHPTREEEKAEKKSKKTEEGLAA